MQKVSAPTRDVLVTRDMSGERTFAGFGAAANEEYADAMIEADKLPLDAIKVGFWCGLAILGMAKICGLMRSSSSPAHLGSPANWGNGLANRTAGLHTKSGGQQTLHIRLLNFF